MKNWFKKRVVQSRLERIAGKISNIDEENESDCSSNSSAKFSNFSDTS